MNIGVGMQNENKPVECDGLQLSEKCMESVQRYQYIHSQRMGLYDEEQELLKVIVTETKKAGLSLRKTANMLGVSRAIVEYARKTMTDNAEETASSGEAAGNDGD